MRKTRLLFPLLLAVALLLAACTPKAPQGIEGRWTSPDMAAQMGLRDMPADTEIVFAFTEDGKVLVTADGKDMAEILKSQMQARGATPEQIAAATVPEVGYRVEGNKLTLHTTMGGITREQTNEFKLNGDTLTLLDSKGDLTLTKVK